MASNLDAGQKVGEVPSSPYVMPSGKEQIEEAKPGETQIWMEAAGGESQLSGIPARVVFLAGDLQIDLGNRRVLVSGGEVTLSDIENPSSYCTACGSRSGALQGKKSGETEYDQCSGGMVVLQVNLSRIGQRLGDFATRVAELFIRSGVGSRNLAAGRLNLRNSTAVRSCWSSTRRLAGQVRAVKSPWSPKDGWRTNFLRQLLTRSRAFTISLQPGARLAACLQACRNWRELYPKSSSSGDASISQDIDQSPKLDMKGGDPGTAHSSVNLQDPVGTSSSCLGTLTQPGLDEFLLTQRRFIGPKLEGFLQALLEAYSKVAAKGGNDPLLLAPVVPLVDVYESLQWSPSQTREYSKNEFARDIYLLHRSGLDKTASGVQVSFPISRGVPEKTFTTTDENGVEKRYFGIRFMKVAGSLGRQTAGIAP